MALQLDELVSLDALDAPGPTTTGLPLMLAANTIDEDPEQPRREFDANALDELAQTIRERGVRQPISVRPNMPLPGRWILNFGARRLRAARLAGLAEVPAFMDTTADSYDQVIENEQREGLKPMEIALFVQKRLAQGDSKSEIARRLGKSRAWLTMATALIEPPDWLLRAYREGRCSGLGELYELRRLHGDHPAAVQAWAEQEAQITRGRLADLRAGLEAPAIEKTGVDDPVTAPPPQQDVVSPAAVGPATRQTDARIHVEFDGSDYQLIVGVAPVSPGTMYVRPLAGGPRRQVPASELRLRGFIGQG